MPVSRRQPRAALTSGWSGAQASAGLQEHESHGTFRIPPVLRMFHVKPKRDESFVPCRALLSLLDIRPMKLQRHLQDDNAIEFAVALSLSLSLALPSSCSSSSFGHKGRAHLGTRVEGLQVVPAVLPAWRWHARGSSWPPGGSARRSVAPSARCSTLRRVSTSTYHWGGSRPPAGCRGRDGFPRSRAWLCLFGRVRGDVPPAATSRAHVVLPLFSSRMEFKASPSGVRMGGSLKRSAMSPAGDTFEPLHDASSMRCCGRAGNACCRTCEQGSS